MPALADTGVRTMVNGPEGVHPGQRVLPRRDRGGRVLRRRRVLRARHRRRGRDRAGDGRVDPRRRPRAGPVAHGRAPVRPASTARRGYTLARVVENYESYYDIRPPGSQRRAGGRCGPRPPTPGTRRTARCSARRPGGSGSSTTSVGRRRRGAADDLRPRGWAGHGWSPWVLPEHRAAREAAALFDESSFAKIEITGPEGGGVRRPRVRDGRVDGPPGVARVHPGARRPRRRRDGRHGDPRGAGRVPRRDRHGARVARPGLAARPGPGGGERGADRGRQRRLGVLRALGAAGPRRARPAHPGGPVERGVPVPDDAGDDRRRRPGARAAGDLRRRARLGAVLPGGVRRGAVAHARRGRRRRTGCGLRATGRSRACGWRRATGSGASDVSRDTTPDEAGLGVRGASGRRVRRGGGAGGGPRPRARPGGCAAWCSSDPRAVALGSEPVRARRTGDVARVRHVGRLRLHRRPVDRLRAAARRRSARVPRSRCRSTASGWPPRSSGGRCTTRRASASGRDGASGR